MAIRTSGILTGMGPSDFVRMKDKVADLQRQLGSGKKSETYGGLGADRGFALAFRASLSQIDAWQQNISLVSTRVTIIETSLQGVQKTIASTKTSMQPNEFTLSSGRTIGQVAAGDGLDAIISMLNASDGSRFVFSGRKSATPPVLDSSVFMNGDGSKDGFKTTLLERMQADLGVASASPERDPAATGRLTVSAAGVQPVTIAEDGVHTFGLKIGTTSGALDGITATPTAGPPASLSIAAGAGNTSPGQALTLSFTLPDGTTERITLNAVDPDAEVVASNEFKVGATSAETLDNLRATLGVQLGKLVGSKLAAASAVKAGDDFFHGETNPAALAGPPVIEPGVPKRLVAGVSGTMADAVAYDTPQNAETNTVRWYQGDRVSTNPRSTASAEIDSAQSVSYGVRADEEALRTTVQYLAVASSLRFTSTDTNALDRYQALTPRIVSGLSMENAAQTVESIRVEIAAANTGASSAKTRHTDSRSMLGGLLTDIEGVDDNEVAVQILALQTNLQASYQTTSMLSQLSLLKYL
jgi:flagellar hook-associated protein 3 FlgL